MKKTLSKLGVEGNFLTLTKGTEERPTGDTESSWQNSRRRQNVPAAGALQHPTASAQGVPAARRRKHPDWRERNKAVSLCRSDVLVCKNTN